MTKAVHKREWLGQVTYYLAWILLGIFLLVAVFAPWLATDQPIFLNEGGETYWPAISGEKVGDQTIQNAEKIIFAPVPFPSEQYTKLEERLKPPGSETRVGKHTFIHYLGTDRLGRDVAAGLIHGCRKSLGVGIITIFAAAIFGICLGAIAGYWGNQLPIKISWSLILLFLIISYSIYLFKYSFIQGWLATLITIFFGIIHLLVIRYQKAKHLHFPIDLIVLKLIEVFQSIPALLLLMVIAGFIQSFTLLTLSLLIATIRWTTFARHTRAEVIKIKSRDYITAVKISGLSNRKIITHYVLPEALGPLLVVFAFGVSSVILLESTLSFIGIGIALDNVTWETFLVKARNPCSPGGWQYFQAFVSCCWYSA